jgi:hypothetical protein
MKVYLAFQKRTDSPWARLFQWRTGSPYPHVEIAVEQKCGCAMFYGVTYGGVRRRLAPMDAAAWDFVEVQAWRETIEWYYDNTAGDRFNWLGMLGAWIGVDISWRGRWRCSEWVAWAIGLPYSHTWNVRKLWELNGWEFMVVRA